VSPLWPVRLEGENGSSAPQPALGVGRDRKCKKRYKKTIKRHFFYGVEKRASLARGLEMDCFEIRNKNKCIIAPGWVARKKE